jgi:FkbM family methyltransferase
MLISFSTLCEKYGFVPKGILHIGAHELEEMKSYLDLGVDNIIWIEGNQDLVDKNSKKIAGTSQVMISSVVYSEDDLEMDFNITNNMQSSSLLEFDKHKNYHPSVTIEKTIKVKTSRVDTILEKNSISKDRFDFVNLDIQGVEMKALSGFGEYMDQVKYIYTEVNTGSVYKDNDLLDDLDNFLKGLGFKRVETSMTDYEWGDAFYIRN